MRKGLNSDMKDISAALSSVFAIELVTLSKIEIVTKIIIEILIGCITIYYLYKKHKQK